MSRPIRPRFEAVVESSLDAEVVADCMSALVSMAGDEHCKVVISGDFSSSVRRLGGPPTYVSQRPGGIVGGKTIRRADGSIVVVIDAKCLRPNSYVDKAWAFAHEGGHVALHGRGEDRYALGAKSPPRSAADVFQNRAAEALEEFRIEKALRAQAIQGPSYGQPVSELAAEVATIAERSLPYLTDRSLERLPSTFSQLTTAAGYLAAELRCAELPRRSYPAWFLRPWSTFAGELSGVPDSRHGWPIESGNVTATRVAHVFESWLSSVGLALWDSAEGITWRAVPVHPVF